MEKKNEKLSPKVNAVRNPKKMSKEIKLPAKVNRHLRFLNGVNFGQLRTILQKYEKNEASLIPVLQEIQGVYSYLPKTALDEIARFLKIPLSHIYGVVTFYAQFYLERRGKNIIKICRGTACHIRGGRRVKESAEKFLNIKEGETTPDYKFTLETAACLGTCFLAPVMMVNNNYYGRLNEQKIKNILKSI